MALFPVTSNPSWRQAAILDNFEWPYLHTDSFDPLSLYSAHRAVIFAIAQHSFRVILKILPPMGDLKSARSAKS